MKRMLISLLLLLLMPVFSACSGNSTSASYTISEPGTWHDGTYTASADGYRGAFTVTVTISGGHISSIDASSNEETPDIGGEAITTMIPDMIDQQSYDVDTVSGATKTSDALRDAVARCLADASAS